jgi:hypothetical protein
MRIDVLRIMGDRAHPKAVRVWLRRIHDGSWLAFSWDVYKHCIGSTMRRPIELDSVRLEVSQ